MSSHDRFEQIDLLYLIHRLEGKKQKILERFENLEKKKERYSHNEIQIKIKALDKVAEEINQKLEVVKEKFSQSYNFMDLCHGLEASQNELEEFETTSKNSDTNEYHKSQKYELLQREEFYKQKIIKVQNTAQEYLWSIFKEENSI